MKFKVGDKVRVIGCSEPQHFLSIGSHGEIFQVDEDDKTYYIDGEGESAQWYQRLILNL